MLEGEQAPAHRDERVGGILRAKTRWGSVGGHERANVREGNLQGEDALAGEGRSAETHELRNGVACGEGRVSMVVQSFMHRHHLHPPASQPSALSLTPSLPHARPLQGQMICGVYFQITLMQNNKQGDLRRVSRTGLTRHDTHTEAV